MIKELPSNYKKKETKEPSRNQKIGLWMVIIGLSLVILQGLSYLYPYELSGVKESMRYLLYGSISFIMVMFIHETLHFIVYKYYGVNARYTIIKSKTWGICPAIVFNKGYLNYRECIVSALAPQIMTIGLIVYSAIHINFWGYIMIIMACCNFCGGAADMYGVCQLLKLPKTNWYGDDGDKMAIYEKLG